MIKKILSLILCFAVVAVYFSACGDGTDKQMVLPIDSEPEYLDPQIVSDPGAENIIANCFEGLVAFDENGQLVPAAASSWKISDDGLTYTFKLRDDLWWKVTSTAGKTIGKDYEKSFDASLTAADFVFGLRRALRPETKSPYAQNLMSIKNAAQVNSGKLTEKELGVKAKDERTVVIKLENPDPDLLLTLTAPACMPCSEKFFELTKGRYGLSTQYLIYNGPFYISNWAEKTSITARRNDRYHADKTDEGWLSNEPAKPSSVYFSFNDDQSTRAKKVKDGTYDTAPLTNRQAQSFAGSKKISVKSFNSGVLSLIFNCTDPVFSNVKIRKAIAQTVDLNAVLDLLGTNAAKGIIPSCAILGGKSYRDVAAAANIKASDEKTAVKLLKTGMEQIEADTLDITILCDKEHENIVRSIMQKWQSVFGVIFGVSVVTEDVSSINKKLKSGDYQAAFVGLEYSDASAFDCVQRYTSDSRNNPVALKSAKYDAVIAGFNTAGSVKQKAKVLEKAEEYLISNSIIIPVSEYPTSQGIAKNVSGLIFSPSGRTVYFKQAIK